MPRCKMLRRIFCHKKRGKDGARNKENVNGDLHENEVDDERDGEDQKEKKDLCYEVKHSDVMGRYLVASRDIAAGELIMEQPALAVGPCAGCPLICLACYRELDDNQIVKCKGCKWPTCSTTCYGLGSDTGHPTYECDVLKGVTPNYGDLDDLRESYHAIMPLRCLLLKKVAPEKWKSVSEMEPHNELRKARGDIWPVNERQVVSRLKKWGLKYEDEEIHTVCGILEVNAFEVGPPGSSARALYGGACLLAHGCVASTAHTEAAAAPHRPLAVRAAVPHRRGDMFTLTYAYTLQGTLKRREHLFLSKFFWCSCARCADPSELGTFASAFACPARACGGRVLPAEPLAARAPWACACCGYTMTADSVYALITKLTDEFDQIDANDIDGFEGFLYKYRNVLYEGHYLCLSALHSLSQLYGKVTSHLIHEMSESGLRRKLDVCTRLMPAFDKLEPGYSRLRGVTLYEMHAPLMILTTREFEKKTISKENLRCRLKEIVGYLTESALILGFEPPQSPEGLMAAAARDALKKIKTWEQIIGKIS